MSEPIPEDVMQRAEEVYASSPIKVTGDFAKSALIWTIARALMDEQRAERERLEKLAREYRPSMYVDVLHSWAVDVVAAIRGQP